MPVCRNCGARISRFDKKICPVCGQVNPIDENAPSETEEVTMEFSNEMLSDHIRKPKVRKKLVVFILSALLGIFAIQFFYLKRTKLALLYLLANIITFCLLFLIFNFAAKTGLLLAILIPVSVLYLANIGVGIYFLVKKDFKDGDGELVR